MNNFIIKIEGESIPVLTANNLWDEASATVGIEALKQQLLTAIVQLSEKYGVVPSKGDYIELSDGQVYGVEGRRLKAKGDGFEVRFTVFETTRYAS